MHCNNPHINFIELLFTLEKHEFNEIVPLGLQTKNWIIPSEIKKEVECKWNSIHLSMALHTYSSRLRIVIWLIHVFIISFMKAVKHDALGINHTSTSWYVLHSKYTTKCHIWYTHYKRSIWFIQAKTRFISVSIAKKERKNKTLEQQQNEELYVCVLFLIQPF